jgi:RNA polymerase sigma-70 factor (ECF subfamily)
VVQDLPLLIAVLGNRTINRSTLSAEVTSGSMTEVALLPALGQRNRTESCLVRKTNDEAALVRRLQTGDEFAFREVVDRFQSKVFSTICGILRNRNDAEDIAQQVFAKVYFSVRNFDARCSLMTWISRITINECYDYLRKRRVRKLVYESDFSTEEVERLETSDGALDPDPPVDRQLEHHDFVVKLLSKVSEQNRTLIWLREVEGHSLDELAAITGLRANTIKIKLFRTRRKLLQLAKRLTGKPLAQCTNDGASANDKIR